MARVAGKLHVAAPRYLTVGRIPQDIDRSFPPFQRVCLRLKWTEAGKTKVYRERWRRFLKVYFQQVVQRSGLDTEDVIAALAPPDEFEESWLIS